MRDLLGLQGQAPAAPIFSGSSLKKGDRQPFSPDADSDNPQVAGAKKESVPIFQQAPRTNAAELSARAEAAGYLVPVIQAYPGAPAEGMLRWIVSSEHTEEEIRTVSSILRRL
jgi:7-keto-8-aminopelargonate synthetase-like enzyme